MDFYNLKLKPIYDGIISLQTLSWLNDYKKPLFQVFRLSPRWFALSSLFYDGDISCKIKVKENKNNRERYYNIYSIPEITRYANRYKYFIKKIETFEINKKLIKPNDPNFMKTYTLDVHDGKRKLIQKSGPLFMPWYFILFEKKWCCFLYLNKNYLK